MVRREADRNSDILHVPCRLILITRLITTNRTHFIVVAIVFVGVFSGILVGVLLNVFCLILVQLYS